MIKNEKTRQEMKPIEEVNQGPNNAPRILTLADVLPDPELRRAFSRRVVNDVFTRFPETMKRLAKE